MGKGEFQNHRRSYIRRKILSFLGAKPNLELLIKGGADVNIPDMDNETPLHKSLQHGNFSDHKLKFIKQFKISFFCLKIKRKTHGCYLRMVPTLMLSKLKARRHYILLLKMVINFSVPISLRLEQMAYDNHILNRLYHKALFCEKTLQYSS